MKTRPANHETTSHRPFPLPARPWVQEHTWHDLLFAHWPVPDEQLRRLIPRGLELDTFNAKAWIGVIPFRISNIRLRGRPAMPVISSFTELNVRTYVKYRGKPGVYFFSLDADSLFNVIVARNWYNLSYFYSSMEIRHEGERIHFSSCRRNRAPAPEFHSTYRPNGAVFNAQPGSLEHWFTERYCLFTTNRRGQVVSGDIHHAPWPLQRAQATFKLNTMTLPLDIKLRHTSPHLLFARKIDVLIWSLSN